MGMSFTSTPGQRRGEKVVPSLDNLLIYPDIIILLGIAMVIDFVALSKEKKGDSLTREPLLSTTENFILYGSSSFLKNYKFE